MFTSLLYGDDKAGLARELGRLDRLIFLSEQEKQIRTYRENRGLPADPPAWILGTEPVSR